MMRFRIGSKYLDLPENADIQFTRKNILFAFDNAECERSTQFTVPATENNRAIFGHAHDVHNSGGGMRVRHEAVLEYRGVQRKGEIYVTEYDCKKHEYKCVFVTGELQGLLSLRQLGKLNEWLNAGTARVMYGAAAETMGNNRQKDWVNLDYTHTGYLRPSYSIGRLIEKALAQGDVPYDPSIVGQYSGFRELRAIVPNPQTPSNLSVKFRTSVIDLNQPTTPAPEGYYNEAWSETNRHGDIIDNEPADFPAFNFGVQTWYHVAMFRARFDMHLTFPSNWSPSDFVISANGGIHFLGGREFTFDSNKTVSGTELKGRTIDIPKLTNFMFVSINDWSQANGWMFAQNGFDRDYEGLVVSGNGTATNGEWIWLQDNLPELTATDLLKVCAAYDRKVLAYSDAKGVYFSDLDFSDSDVVQLQDVVVNSETVARIFGDYAQHNIVAFKNPDEVPPNERTEIDYTMQNVNIQQTRELYAIPYSEGRKDGARNVYVPEEVQDAVICHAPLSGKLEYIKLQKCAGLQAILNKSTQKVVKVAMELRQLISIIAETVLYLHAQRWVWVEMQWQNGVATIKLQKIA